jgi:hypothetical protein
MLKRHSTFLQNGRPIFASPWALFPVPPPLAEPFASHPAQANRPIVSKTQVTHRIAIALIPDCAAVSIGR